MATIKKFILLALAALMMVTGCNTQNKKGVVQNYIVIKASGDTLRVKAKRWRWDGDNNVVFRSDDGSQYVSDVKDILKEN